MTTLDLSSVEVSWHALLSQLPTCGLTALRDALACDSSELVQGCTVEPLPVGDAFDSPPAAACALGYGAWKAWHLRTAREVDREFGNLVVRAQMAAGGRVVFLDALDFFDTGPRAVAFALVLKVAVAVLAQRAKAEVA
jgi:hypothetical protein